MRYAIAAFLGMLALAANASAGETRSLDLAVYQKEKADFSFPEVVAGSFSEFSQELGKGAKMLLVAHTPEAQGGDVVMMNTNVLRTDGGKLADYGVECQLTLYDESKGGNPDWRVAGLCRLRLGGKSVKIIAPKTALPDTSTGVQAWVRIGMDEKGTIAFYANVSD